MGCVRTAGGKRGDPERIASNGNRPALRRQLQAPTDNLRMRVRLDARDQLVVAGVLQVDAVVLPDALQTRSGLPRDRGAMVVRQVPHDPRQRTGGQRMLLAASRLAGQQEGPRAVVYQDHRLRGSIARRSGWDRLAGTDQADAAQLDRAAEMSAPTIRAPNTPRLRASPSGFCRVVSPATIPVSVPVRYVVDIWPSCRTAAPCIPIDTDTSASSTTWPVPCGCPPCISQPTQNTARTQVSAASAAVTAGGQVARGAAGPTGRWPPDLTAIGAPMSTPEV